MEDDNDSSDLNYACWYFNILMNVKTHVKCCSAKKEELT